MYKVSLTRSYFPAMADGVVEAMTIGDLLRRQACAHGDAPAMSELTEHGAIRRTWTYGALLADAARLGRALASRHAKHARIAIYANNVPEWVLMELGASLAGLTLVTVNPSFQRRELNYVLEQSRAEAIYYVESFRGNPIQEIVEDVCRTLPSIKHRILLSDQAALFAGAEHGVLPDVAPSDIAQIQYNSGTTGFPKGALLHHHGLVQNAADAVRRVGLGAGDRYLLCMPLFHTAGCSVLVLGGLNVGACMLLAPHFDPRMIVEVFERERTSFILAVPTMLVALADEAERSGRDVSSMKRFMSGGSMVAPELVRRVQAIFGSIVQIIYGQTEASPGVTLAWPDDTLEDLTQTIGQPLPHLDVAILDTQTNAVVALEEQGEICVRGYNVMTGYNDNPDATAKAIDAEGWLHTGDLGQMDARGYLKITGRVKEMILRGGENLFPAEIENVILVHADIAEAAVVGVPDELYGEQVACFMRRTARDVRRRRS